MTITATAVRDGETFDPALDAVRLSTQHRRVFDLMQDGAWRTLSEISAATGDPEPSVSSRLRDFRKPRFGGHVVERQRKDFGLFAYRMVVKSGYTLKV